MLPEYEEIERLEKQKFEMINEMRKHYKQKDDLD